MAADGTPEPAAQRCGAAVARLRTLRDWSRAKLVARLYDEIDPADPGYNRVSVAWLARLENGRAVKVSRQMAEALCRALACTPQERAWLLLSADRNVLVDQDREPSAVVELLTYTLDRVHTEAHETLAARIGDRRASALDELEALEIVASALEIMIAQRRQEAPPPQHIGEQHVATSPHAERRFPAARCRDPGEISAISG